MLCPLKTSEYLHFSSAAKDQSTFGVIITFHTKLTAFVIKRKPQILHEIPQNNSAASLVIHSGMRINVEVQSIIPK